MKRAVAAWLVLAVTMVASASAEERVSLYAGLGGDGSAVVSGLHSRGALSEYWRPPFMLGIGVERNLTPLIRLRPSLEVDWLGADPHDSGVRIPEITVARISSKTAHALRAAADLTLMPRTGSRVRPFVSTGLAWVAERPEVVREDFFDMNVGWYTQKIDVEDRTYWAHKFGGGLRIDVSPRLGVEFSGNWLTDCAHTYQAYGRAGLSYAVVM